MNGHAAHLHEHSQSRCLTWSNDEYTFALVAQSTELTNDELLRMAKQLSS
ncbi:hypothetical protein ACIHFE_33950 [Streptomyces sp. NPDC052396]